MPSFEINELNEYIKRVIEAIGASCEHAELVASRLVNADLCGVNSHGVIRMQQYLDAVSAGILNPKAEPQAEVDTPCYANVNGNRSFGQVAASFAIELAIEKAKKTGIALVGCYNMNHVGRLGDYVQMASEQDLVGLAFCNGGGPNVAPFGAREKVLGSNPMVFSAPSRNGRTVLVDFTSSVTSEGRIREARNKGEQIPENLVLDKDGKPTTDPDDLYKGGAILTMGGVKGSALSIAIEILAGILTGGRCSAFDDYVEGNGVLFFTCKPDLFRERACFDRDIELLYQAVTGAKKAAGVETIYFPGGPEAKCRISSLKDGVQINETIWESITKIGDSVGVAFKPTQAKM